MTHFRMMAFVLVCVGLTPGQSSAETPTFSATVNANGTLASSFGVAKSKRQSAGQYLIDFNAIVGACAATTSLRGATAGLISTVQGAATSKRVTVYTFNTSGVRTDRDFHLVVSCTNGVPVQGAGDLVITEVMADPSAVADAVGEWVEVLNTTPNAINLNGLTLAAGASSTTVNQNILLPAGGYFVFGRNADQATNGGVLVDYVFSFALVNSSTSLAIKKGSATIDEVSFAGAFTAGRARSLDANKLDSVSNDDNANWCNAVSQYGLGDYGTPGAPNPTCP